MPKQKLQAKCQDHRMKNNGGAFTTERQLNSFFTKDLTKSGLLVYNNFKLRRIIMDYLNIKLQGINETGEEKDFSLADFKGKKVVLYFYPKDNTSGCTQEACDFRDNFNRLTSKAEVIGVSPDSIKSHLKFKENHNLNFTLLSDPEHTLSEAFGAWGEKSMYGRKYMGIIRSTFILDENGQIQKEWRKVKVKGHVDEVLSSL